jgi:hypothetical protein
MRDDSCDGASGALAAGAGEGVEGSERFLDLAMRPNQSTGVPVGRYTGTAGLMKRFARAL